jgi:2-polyprenyl-3-methyl-5-hydroxy-6-metoxy-1,4-benzoquinol methylase
MNIEKKYPMFHETSVHLQNKANFFKISLPKLFDEKYNFELAERICQIGFKASENNREKYFKNVNGLIQLSLDFLKLQVLLEKEGRYLYTTFEEVKKMYESSEDNGPNYLWGLYFSEIFWKIHCNLTNFFIDEFVEKADKCGTVLEVPIGTGYYLSEFLLKKVRWKGLGIDLAENAVEFAKKICYFNNIEEQRFTIIKQDFTTYTKQNKFERIICGEFLEHVEDPVKIMKQLSNLLTTDGKIFLTAAIWSGGVDHIYLYENPKQVRQHISEAGLIIEKELVQPVFDKHKEHPEKGKIPINYAAVLSKSN